MKQIVANYTFNAAAKTVTLTDFGTIRLDRLQLIVDTTTNTILYNFADSSIATATVATNVITLSTVGSAASTDKLQIIYDAVTGDPTYDTPPLASNAAKETGGNLATLVTNTTGLATAGGGGYIRQDSTATIAKESGGNLATLVTNTTGLNNANQATGSAVPSRGIYIGISDGTNLVGAKTASAAKGTTGTGLLGVGALGFDGTNYQAIKTKSDGTLVPGTTSSSAVTSVASAATSTQLLAANASRTGAYFYNDSLYPLYIAFNTSASTSSYTVQVPSGGFYEMPTQPVYTGAIFGIWSTANGNARITELS